jgi:hypothetical protein
MPNTRKTSKTANNPKGFAEHYFSRQKYPLRQLQFAPSGRLKYVVVIPAFCEPRITEALDALYECARPEGDIEVIVVINYPESLLPLPSVKARKAKPKCSVGQAAMKETALSVPQSSTCLICPQTKQESDTHARREWMPLFTGLTLSAMRRD